MKLGRFVFDCHIHCGKKDAALPDSKLQGVMAEVEEVDNSDMILYDMDAYGVDMGLLLPSFTGTTNAGYGNIVKRHPKKFVSCCMDTNTRLKAIKGEKEWNIDDAIKEIDEALTNEPDVFVGIGEFAPGCMGALRYRPTRYQRFEELCAVAELATAHDVPMYFHEYSSINIEGPFTMLSDVLAKYPNFKVIIAHGGGYKPFEIEKACILAGSHDTVYLETGYWKADYYEYALKDYHVGAKRLIWGGGDTGSRLWYPQATRPAAKYGETTRVWHNRNNWVGDHREADYQPDYYGWATHQIHRLKDFEMCTQDEINLIIGGNAARIFKLKLNPLITFCVNRPDLFVPNEEGLNRRNPVDKREYGAPGEEDYAPNAYYFK